MNPIDCECDYQFTPYKKADQPTKMRVSFMFVRFILGWIQILDIGSFVWSPRFTNSSQGRQQLSYDLSLVKR